MKELDTLIIGEFYKTREGFLVCLDYEKDNRIYGHIKKAEITEIHYSGMVLKDVWIKSGRFVGGQFPDKETSDDIIGLWV